MFASFFFPCTHSQIFHEWPGVQLENGKYTTYSACDTTLLFIIAMQRLKALSEVDPSEDAEFRSGRPAYHCDIDHFDSRDSGTRLNRVLRPFLYPRFCPQSLWTPPVQASKRLWSTYLATPTTATCSSKTRSLLVCELSILFTGLCTLARL